MTEDITGCVALSVVIPTFNAGSLLAEALDSVLTQADPRTEVLIVDDGSTDDTPRLLTRYGGCVRVIRQPNSGLGAARTRGHAEARGEFIAWFDADDICDPRRFQLQLAAFAKHPELGLVSSDFSAFDEAGTISESFARRYYGSIPSDGPGALFDTTEWIPEDCADPSASVPLHFGKIYKHLAFGNFVHPPTVMLRRDLALAVGPLHSEFGAATDWEFLVRASRLAPFGYLERPLLRYRRWHGQITSDSQVLRNVPKEISAFESILAADPSLRERRDRVGRLYRHWFLSLASASAELNRYNAVRWLARSACHGIEPLSFGKTALRISTPSGVLAAYRRFRGL